MNSSLGKTGIYICHCGVNIAGVVDVKKLVEELKEELGESYIVKDYEFMCSDPGQILIEDDIKEEKLDRVVIAACSPKLHEPTFRRVLAKSGLNPYLLEMANIREHCSWVHMKDPEKATKKAKDIIKMSIARSKLLEPLEKKKVKVLKSALVIGGGIAGIEASLNLANQGFKVYLLEETPSIGGRMAQWDKVFPTGDCSICILGPKMVDVHYHENIELLTYSELLDVEGEVGSFRCKIKKKTRFVDESKCTGCGLCSDLCPVEVPNEFEFGLGSRKAIYVPFPQAVPLIYVIDKDNCIGCGLCSEVCEPEAINYESNDEEIEIEVGTIIVAVGGDPFDPSVIKEYNYSEYPDVITTAELERILNTTGPTRGKLIRPSDNKVPKRIAFVQCAGFRDDRFNEYCSRFCCMASLKESQLIKEKHPDAEIFIFYMDIRAFGKGYEEYYKRIQKEFGVKFIRGRIAEIVEKNGVLLVRGEDTLLGEPIELEMDLVVLSVGMVPSKYSKKVQEKLKLCTSPDGFLMEAHPKLRPVETETEGIYICGYAQGPKDIQDSVAQAAASAAKASTLMARGEVELEALIAEVDQDKCTGCKLCETICEFNAPKVVEKKANISEKSCVGCGVCVGACPADAIKIYHFTDEQIRSQMHAVLSSKREVPLILVFACNWCSYVGADLAGISRYQYPTNVRIIRMMCSGRLDPAFVLEAFYLGADGVLITGCHPGDCHYRFGNIHAEKRYYALKEILGIIGIDPRRLRLEWISASEGERFASVVTDMVREIKEIGPIGYEFLGV